ncbi:MAG: hypothetical protein EZS28_010049 [Streblomastix strix]|uniref:Uncharacterized protein n=1 Tax=Streblomastix strix TaxID=222440 RepID=A0A5J4WJG0_9EUKA|nr:MAG: hypothetical protein EZS28_010049 [Streblomastix strix]
MLIQFWRHLNDEQLPETLLYRSQTTEQHQQLGGKLMRQQQSIETLKDNRTKLNFLGTQFSEASLYLMLIYSAKTRIFKTQCWTGIIVSPLDALKELYCQIKKITENKKQYIQDPIPQAIVVTDASSQEWEQHLNQILERFQQLMEHGQTTKCIGLVIGKNGRQLTQKLQLSQDKDQHNSRCSSKIVQIRRLSLSPIPSRSNKIDFNGHKRLTCPKDRCIF